ncbi:MAG: 4-hydroxy-tetrahydrodipicolinate reductase [Ruminococcaceae bacterium]|nr:4-hydroxy-tetrahydrodipicolinate reductase [Oscillospiraceae bacterium]
MKIIVHGAAGRMGTEVTRLISGEYELAAAVDAFGGEGFLPSLDDFSGDADCIIDFSNHTATEALLAYAVKRNIPVVLATTGHTEDELAKIRAAAKAIPVFHSANMSLGVAVLCSLAKQAAAAFPDADIEIVEKHHNRKLDVPSGTALMLANEIKEVRPDAEYVIGRHEYGKRKKNEIGIHSLRLGNVVGEHEIIISTDTQSLTLKHEAASRNLFADGAMTAAKFIVRMPAGLYQMKDIIEK